MRLAEVQIIRKIVLGVGVLIGVSLFALTASIHRTGAAAYETIVWAGILAMLVCISGRTWAALYIGGHKSTQLVTDGPYSVVRNPLYFFSILGAAGAGAQNGSVLSALIFGLLAWAVFRLVVPREERLLALAYGPAYAAYVNRVPRFVPNPRLWRDVPTLTVSSPRILRTFGDGLVFLLSIPVARGFGWLQDAGVLPTLVHLF